MAGLVGGFLAPVLMSTGDGSHVLLFSYYALLNIGILAIAWFKSWRELNLLGFFFTFAIATLWGASAYQPQYFASTEPFLVFFFLLYVVSLGALCPSSTSQSQGIYRRTAGLWPAAGGNRPAVLSGSGLSIRHGHECSWCLACSTPLLATLLWRRLQEGMRMLTEAFLALGIVFGSLTIPLALGWPVDLGGLGPRRCGDDLGGSASGTPCRPPFCAAAAGWRRHRFSRCRLVSLWGLGISQSIFPRLHPDLTGSPVLQLVPGKISADRLRHWEGLSAAAAAWSGDSSGGIWPVGNEADRQFAEEEFANILLLYLCCSTMAHDNGRQADRLATAHSLPSSSFCQLLPWRCPSVSAILAQLSLASSCRMGMACLAGGSFHRLPPALSG